MRRFHIGFRRLCAIVPGLVFLISGLLKMMDPVGTGLIVSAYLQFFGMPSLSAGKFPLVAGMALSFLEGATGAALLTGAFRKLTGWVAMILTTAFLIITGILLWKNPEMDCGCFGEALHLTHEQSFWKNVVLEVLVLAAFLPLKAVGKAPAHRCVAFCIAALSMIFAIGYSYVHLPLIDFTAFRPGAQLYAAMDDAEPDTPATPLFVYEKDGEQQLFPLDALPDSTWTFVGTDPSGDYGFSAEEAPVLAILDDEGLEQDEMAVLGPVMVFPVFEPESASWERIAENASMAEGAGVTALALTSAAPGNLPAEAIPEDLLVYYSDYKTLITLCRRSGGAVYLSDGEVIAKWSPRDFPSEEELDEVLETDPIIAATNYKVHRRVIAQGYLLFLLAVILLV